MPVNFEQMKKGFAVNVISSASEWIVVMEPKRGQAVSKIVRVVIHFDKKDMSFNTLKMEENSGNSILYKFIDKEFNLNLDSRLFNIS